MEGNSTKMSNLLTVPQVAEILNLSDLKVYRMINNREIPFIKIGRSVRIHPKSLEKYMKDNEVQPDTQQ